MKTANNNVCSEGCFSKRFIGIALGAMLVCVLSSIAPAFAFAVESVPVDGDITITLATQGASASALAKTGDALAWLAFGLFAMLIGACVLIWASRKAPTSAGCNAPVSAGQSTSNTLNTSSTSSSASNNRGAVSIVIASVLIALLCFGQFAVNTAYAAQAPSGITCSSQVVVNEEGQVISNSFSISNASDDPVCVESIQASESLSGWSAQAPSQVILAGADYTDAWDAKDVSADIILQLKSNGGTITLPMQIMVSIAEEPTPVDPSIAQRLLAIDGITSVEPYSNDAIKEAGLDQTYEIYEITFSQAIDHNDPSAGTFEQHARLFYTGMDALNVVDTDGYMFGNLPSTAYRNFYNQTFFDRYGTLNIIQIEYRYFGSSVPDGLDINSTALWDNLTMEQAATDFHEVIQKMSKVLTGKRLWAGTSKGGLTTDYQCYFQEQHGYNDADAFVAFCAPFCQGTNDSRFMDAVYGDIGYKAYGEEQAAQWHELMDKFQLACIKHREELQTRYYEQACEEGYKFRSYFGTDETTQAKKLWDVVVNEYPVLGFWQYYQSSKVEDITNAINEDDPDKIYACVVEAEAPNSFAYNSGFISYAIQALSEMGDYSENFDYLRQLVAKAKETAPDEEKDAYYLATDSNVSYSVMYLNEEQLSAITYNSSTRDAMVEWFNTTNTAHLIMISGQSDPWYFVRPDLSFNNSQIKTFESTYNHLTVIETLSEEDQANIWETLDGWLDSAKS